MSGTTSLSELPYSKQQASPTNPVNMTVNQSMDVRPPVANTNANVSVNVNELSNNNNNNNNAIAEQKDYNTLVTGIQQASAAGMTSLPSRDIPQMQSTVTQDDTVRANYVPPVSNSVDKDYIGSVMTNDDIIKAQQNKQKNEQTVNNIYDTLQTPVMIAMLFFIFQTPILKTTALKYIPSLFNKDGNPNLGGYLFQSVLFGGTYYGVTRLMELWN